MEFNGAQGVYALVIKDNFFLALFDLLVPLVTMVIVPMVGMRIFWFTTLSSAIIEQSTAA